MKPPLLLSREEFKKQVFARDKGKCVFCRLPAVDAHHILDRKLFPDGGYYLSNGASVCEEHHWSCEMTTITVEAVRTACGIQETILPNSLEAGPVYDKWGNIINLDGTRTKGSIFDDSVLKIIKKGNFNIVFEL
jgi:hypothetical protein